jgi:diguanylate cyclase (GGDEF)-like protein
VDSELPCAVVLDVVLPDGGLAGAETIERLHQWRREGVKVICLSSRGDLEARLAAVRAGCEAYFVKPVDAAALIERLDLLTSRPEEPYRVLIVDDDMELAGFYAGTLQGAGMLAVPLTDPMRIMEPLTSLKPDLILMDMYMPGCSGPELAAALRQQEGYLSTPIIFLSTEESMDEQLAALSLGGDEFLTKPIDPRHLVAAVTARAQRGRMLGSAIAYDSLTGLLNHGTLKQHLESELSRASRESLPVAYAMIDVDRFKSINDTYGHAAGDRLLRNLSFFLKQRLRRSDVIGRYGGDEIAVVLPHTDGPTAHRVLEEIRESFAHLRHRFGADEATATFTCGIGVYPACASAERLVEAADQALYTGKRAGKNRVELAS